MVNNFKQFFKNKKVLITGHTGFKGSWLSQILLNWGANIVGVSLNPKTKPNLFTSLYIKKNVKNYFCDIRDFKKLKKIFFNEKPEIIFHLAAQALVRDSYDNPLYTFETNIMGTTNLLQAIKEVEGVKAAVIITTDKVYENRETNYSYKENDKLGGHDPYSGSKAGAEIVINSYIKSFFNPNNNNKKLETLIASARAGNVIGGGDWSKDRLAPDIIKSIFEKNKKIIIRNPSSVRPWQYVLEPLYGYLLLAKKLYEGKKDFVGAWNFGPNFKNYLTVQELTKRAIKILQSGSFIVRKDFAKHEAKLLKLNNNKAKIKLNWQPTLSLNKTLEFTFDWYKNFYEKKDILAFTNKQIKSFFQKI